jgi:hypothetical protein
MVAGPLTLAELMQSIGGGLATEALELAAERTHRMSDAISRSTGSPEYPRL